MRLLSRAVSLFVASEVCTSSGRYISSGGSGIIATSTRAAAFSSKTPSELAPNGNASFFLTLTLTPTPPLTYASVLKVAVTVETEGPKSILHRVLNTADRPLTSSEVWQIVEEEGLKSKRFMKQMLHQMKKGGYIKTVPVSGSKKNISFGYVPAANSYNDTKEVAETA